MEKFAQNVINEQDCCIIHYRNSASTDEYLTDSACTKCCANWCKSYLPCL